jgi:activator of 2-hydroxyglutaryl-CoA dehydratase
MGILEPAGPKSMNALIPPHEEVKIVNQLFVGIDVGSRGNTAYLMRPDGDKHSNFTVQNTQGGAKILIDKIVSALTTMGLEQVVIGMEATGIYGDNLVYALREGGRTVGSGRVATIIE